MRQEAAALLRLCSHAMGPEDGFILVSDRRTDDKTVFRSCSDSKETVATIAMNTLVRLDRLPGQKISRRSNRAMVWANPAAGEGGLHAISGRSDSIHHAPQSGKEKVIEAQLRRHEVIHCLYSFKYSLEDLKSLTAASGMHLVDF